jgi:hypothetical protein
MLFQVSVTLFARFRTATEHGPRLLLSGDRSSQTEAMRGADDSFWERASTAAREGRRVLVLERIARAAGQTCWFLIRSEKDVEVVSEAVRPGSTVQLYVDPTVALEGYASQAMLRSLEPVVAVVRPTENDLVALALNDDDPRCEHDCLDPEEIPEWLRECEGRYVALRYYPQVDEADAEATVADEDGGVRGHPH